MKFSETLGDLANRNRAGEKRVPLRSVSELAEEFSIPVVTLSKLMKNHAGPSSVLRGGINQKNTWYNPVEVRKWWKKYKETNAKS